LEQDVDNRHLLPNLAAYIINILQQAHVGTYEFKLASGTELTALGKDAVGGLLRPPDDEHSWFPSVFGECLESVLADSASAADEDSDQAFRQRRRDTLVRGDDDG
jgi:hypothetical protein